MYNSYINMADIIQLYDCNHFMLNKIEQKNKQIQKLNIRKSIFTAISNAIFPLFGLSGYLVLMLTGANMISASVITFGTLIYVCQLRGGIIPASMMIIKSISNITINRIGIRRIKEIF